MSRAAVDFLNDFGDRGSRLEGLHWSHRNKDTNPHWRLRLDKATVARIKPSGHTYLAVLYEPGESDERGRAVRKDTLDEAKRVAWSWGQSWRDKLKNESSCRTME